MKRLVNSKLLSVCLCVASLSACATTKKGNGLVQVDNLVGWIERVHTNSELAKERVHTAIGELDTIVAFEFEGDAVSAYKSYVASVEESSKQVEELQTNVVSMKKSAEPLFKQWAADLDTFTSLEMRLRSQNRLTETRQRYEAILSVVEPAQSAYEAFNSRLKDHAVYLGHDFNAASVAAIRGDVKELSQVAIVLDSQFDACQDAARDYVEAAALPMTTTAPTEPSTPKRSTRSDG